LADRVKDISDSLLFFFVILLLFLLIDDSDASLEEANEFLVADFARLVHLVIREEGEP